MNGTERPFSFPRTTLWVLGSAACYYLATQVAWALCFPNSKVSLFFPPHAVLVSVLLLVPTRHWWAYTLAAAGAHFLATQQAHWPPLYALHCEAFDAVQNVSLAAGIRIFIKSPWFLLTLRDAIVFVLITAVIVPFGTAFWGAAFTISNHFGTDYWVEWRNLGISNAVTAIILLPAILLGISHLSARWVKVASGRLLEAGLLGAGIVIVGYLAFARTPAGPETSPALLYAPIPLLIWAVLRFGLGGMSASMLAITFQAIWGTMHGRGPFLAQAPAENALALQMFLLFTAAPLMLLAVVIEEQSRAQRAIRESEALNRGVINSLTSLVIILDRSGRVIATNDAWRTSAPLGGVPSPGAEVGVDYLVACRHGARAGDHSCAEVLAGIESVLSGREWQFQKEYPAVTSDGTFWFDVMILPLRSEAGGAVITQRDITLRKQTEAEAQQLRQELAHASRVTTLGQLASSLAHELNQPLAAILSNAQAALRFLNANPTEVGEVRDILKDIASDDRRASQIISRMRAMLKKGETQMESRDLNADAHQALLLLRGDLVARNVSVDTQLSPDLPPVRIDQVQFQQVLLNLVINGCDAMQANVPDERRLVIETARDGSGIIRVSVTDRGAGIAPEMLERIFEPFYTTKAQGMGLGLPICRTIIEAHGGRLWAENNAERGATFRFTLPVEPGEGVLS